MIKKSVLLGAVRVLQREAPGATVVLFGSHARGDADEHSDADFLVIEPGLTSKRSEMVRLRDALRPLRIPVGVVVTSRQIWEEWRDTPGTLFHEEWTEGEFFREEA